MKIISNNNLDDLLAHKQGNLRRMKEIEVLEEKLRKAEDLKEILVSLSDKSKKYIDFMAGSSCMMGELPDNVLVYVDDILGGKVIKQEGVKCLVIDRAGNVKTGLTKQKADKGYTYKLMRN